MYKVQFLRNTRVKLTTVAFDGGSTHSVDIKAGKTFYVQDIEETLEDAGCVRLILEPICLNGGKYYTVKKDDIATKLYDVKFNKDKSHVLLHGVFDQPELMKLADLMPRVVPNYGVYWTKLQEHLYGCIEKFNEEEKAKNYGAKTKAQIKAKKDLLQNLLMDMMEIEMDGNRNGPEQVPAGSDEKQEVQPAGV